MSNLVWLTHLPVPIRGKWAVEMFDSLKMRVK